MFDILFGWRKASKCKRLIRRLHCRLKILKNKRSSIAKQLRGDVAELLKHGHIQTAFDRVEQLFKDECVVEVYDLLDSFGEFVISNLHYIRRNKDCPNDINEAVSSLIFASARFGELPELIAIRKLFGERYGQRFATVAIELLPGNLVNRQVQEKVCIKSVSHDKKCRLVEEILKSSLKSGPLLLEFSSEFHQNLENIRCIDPNPGQENDSDNLGVPNTEHKEKKLKDEGQNQKDVSTTLPRPSICCITSEKTYASSGQKINRRITSPVKESSLVVHDSESSASSEMIHVDDIQELETRVLGRKCNLVDQRVFMFRSTAVLSHCCCCQQNQVRGMPSNQKKNNSDEDATLPISTCSESSSSSASIEDKASYTRAMSMPLARPHDTCIDPVLRSNSFPSKGHVHPNLPDYDKLAATFTALKDARLQAKKLSYL